MRHPAFHHALITSLINMRNKSQMRLNKLPWIWAVCLAIPGVNYFLTPPDGLAAASAVSGVTSASKYFADDKWINYRNYACYKHPDYFRFPAKYSVHIKHLANYKSTAYKSSTHYTERAEYPTHPCGHGHANTGPNAVVSYTFNPNAGTGFRYNPNAVVNYTYKYIGSNVNYTFNPNAGTSFRYNPNAVVNYTYKINY